MKKLPLLILLMLMAFSAPAQEIKETNTDIIYRQALEHYKSGNFRETLRYTEHGLSLAPQYHDIRILLVRALWAIENYSDADEDLDYLLQNVPKYIDVRPLALQRLTRFTTSSEALEFAQRLEQIYPNDTALQLKKAQLFFDAKKPQEARLLANKLITDPGITGEQRYRLQTILNRTVSNEIGLNYQNISFSEDYSRNRPWNNMSAEYQHNFKSTAVIGRVNYSDRSYDQSFLYELEAYPVFSDRFYTYTNVGFSEGTLFPDFRSSVSLYYNFAKVFEGEAGGRLLTFNGSTYFTGILGLSLYQGKFLFNLRTFVGPERKGSLIQNYQSNVRYYLNLADNYLFLRIGSGISPDERFNYSQVQENPALKAYYTNIGFRHLFWRRHIFQVQAGFLFEDISTEKTGDQFNIGLGYRLRM